MFQRGVAISPLDASLRIDKILAHAHLTIPRADILQRESVKIFHCFPQLLDVFQTQGVGTFEIIRRDRNLLCSWSDDWSVDFCPPQMPMSVQP